MPAGRNQVAYDDIGFDALTLKADGVTIVFDQTQPRGAAAATLDKAVVLSGNDTIALAADGDAVVGKLLKVESDGMCSVQNEGFTTLPAGASVTVTRGAKIVGALGAAGAKGYIRDGAPGTAAEIPKMAHRIINNADTTAVVVELE